MPRVVVLCLMEGEEESTDTQDLSLLLLALYSENTWKKKSLLLFEKLKNTTF